MGDAALEAAPDADLAFAQGMAAQEAGDLARAEAVYRAAIAADPKHAGALHNLAILAAHGGRTVEALELLRATIEVDPSIPEARFNLGTLLLAHGEDATAETELSAAVALKPAYPEALVNLGRARQALGRSDEAVELWLKAEALAPQYTPALTNLGAALMARGRYREAGERFAQVLQLDPGSADAAYNVANALKALGLQAEAVQFYDQALQLRPGYVEALINRANALRELERLDEAIETYATAIQLRPDAAKLHLNLGQILRDRGDAEAARLMLRRALQLDPDDANARIARLMAELPLAYADEAEVAASRARYAEGLQALAAWAVPPARREALAKAVGVSQPFYLAYQDDDDRALQAAYGELVGRAVEAVWPPLPAPPKPAAGARIRVGIVSGFFRAHSNWKIPIRGWLEGLDRARFEVIGYHTSSKRDVCTDEAERLCDRFVQGPYTIEAWRERIAADAPHVLIYPEIGMDPTVPKLAAQRLAPVQCASWGHPDTSGFATIDAYLSSELMEPPGADAAYTERLVRLPGLGVQLAEPGAQPAPLPREMLGLRPDSVVFWCGQSIPKYLPRWDAVWPRIAKATPQTQFVFIGLLQASAAEAVFRTRLAQAFAVQGLDVDRHCVVLPRLSEAEFTAAMGSADVFLDSLGWSGCNSALEAVAWDLPIVTSPGRFMRGRHSSAILTAMGLADAVAPDVDVYVETAVRLADDPAARADLRRRIAEGKARLWVDDAPVRALEAFLEEAVAAS